MKLARLVFILALALANSAMAGMLVQTVTFDQSQMNVINVDGYQLITVPGYATSSELGKPSLPQVVQSMALPAGAVITGVQLISRDEQPLPGKYFIAPAQHAQPLPMPGKTFHYPKAEPDPSVYGVDKIYPEATVRALGSGSMCGYSIGRVEIYPVRYNPITRTAYFTNSVTYMVTYQENAEPASTPTQFQKDVFGQVMRSLVANAGDIDRFAPTVRTQGTSKSLAAGSFKYVTISGSASFDTVFARLAAWKTSKGVRDTVIPVAWITSNYTGYDNAEKIRNFIIEAKNTWGTVYVLLAGQGDDKNSSQNLIPARHAYYTASGAGYYSDEDQIPSDLYYSDLDGTWDSDGDHTYGETTDGCNLYPDVYVGRAPVTTVAQAQNFVAKVMKYEKAPPTGFITRMILPAGILWSSYEERPTQRAIKAMTPTGWTDDTLFERNSGLSEATFISHFNTGNGGGHWMGHGDENGIYYNGGSSAFYTSSDADGASNGDKTGIYNSIACFTGAWDEVASGDCFAEHIINRLGGGAVGVMMNSRYGWGAYVGSSYVMGPSEMIDTTFWHRLFYDGIYNMGQVLASAKTAWVPYADQSNQYEYMRWCLYESNLLGDPELPMWTVEPDSMRLTYNATVPTGSSSYSVTVTDRSNIAISGALVCLRTKSNVVYATGTTNSSGVASITIAPASAETLFIGATARNKLATFGSALIAGTASPALAVSMTSWAPAAAGGTSSAVNVTNSATTDIISYTVSSNQTWLTVSAASGSTPGSFTMTAAANTGASRSATVTVTATAPSGTAGSPKTITITQAAAATPTLAISMTSWAPAAAGGTSSAVSVTNSGSSDVIAYTVSSNQTWLTVSAASGNTPGSFTMTAAANTGSARTATVTVTATTGGVANSPQTIAISQAASSGQNDAGTGGDAGNTLALATTVSPGSWTGCYLDGTDREDYYKFSVTSGQMIKVKITPPSSADYDLYLYNPSQTQVGSSLRGAGLVDSIIYTATVTGYFYGRAYEYSGTGNYNLEITISGGAAPTLAVSMTSWTPAAAGGTSSAVSVTNSTTSSVIAYTVSSNQTWLTVSAASGSTPGSFTMTAAANTSSARTATVTVTATTSGVSGSPKTISVSQAAGTGGQNDAGTGGDAGNTLALATTVSPGSWTGCYLDATDREDYYKFNVTSGQVIKVRVTPPSSADYDLYLYNPSQTQVGSSTRGAGYVDSIIYTATVSGYFYCRAYEYSGTGNYSLLISISGSTGTWTMVTQTTQSAHPYTNSYNYTWTITGPTAATKMMVYLDSIKTESGYDSVFVMNNAGTVVSKWSGTYRAVWSGEVTGNVVKIKLKTDASVTGYGFLSTKYQYYTTTANVAMLGAEKIGMTEDNELLSQNHPNPVNGRTTINYNLPDDRQVSLRVYNISGQLVKTLASSFQPAGKHSVEWDARDDFGRTIANGTYIYRLDAGNLSAIKKMIILK